MHDAVCVMEIRRVDLADLTLVLSVRISGCEIGRDEGQNTTLCCLRIFCLALIVCSRCTLNMFANILFVASHSLCRYTNFAVPAVNPNVLVLMNATVFSLL